jgi:hypothetical protein
MNILDVKKWNYGSYSNDNYGNNSIAFKLGIRTIYFSYDTPVAFRGTNSKGEYFNCVIQNYWSTTTGKHLNWIDGGDKNSRLTKEEFKNKLQEFLK